MTPFETLSDLRRKVGFLSQPGTYPDRTARVEPKETHMSWVFLTDRFVYKLKKPIRARQLDFSTIALREHFCREELRLNRRLAASVYLAVVPLLMRSESGELALDGPGEPVDWLVKMRRLSDDLMLDEMIRAKATQRSDVEEIAALLTAFYSRAQPVPVEPADYVARFREELVESDRVLCSRPVLGLAERSKAVLHAAQHFAVCQRTILESPARRGRIIEGHGDLRPEHVCNERPPVVIDCLEFNPRLRLVDPLDEVTFLAMEGTRLGAEWIEPVLFECCAARIQGWTAPPPLVAFYKCAHALTRARLAVLHLEDAEPRDPEKWPKKADEYLRIAEAASAVLA